MVIPVAGVLVSSLVGWCARRFVLALTRNDNYAELCFIAGMVVTAAAFIHWVWKPLRSAIKRLAGQRD